MILPEHEAKRLLAEADIPVIPAESIHSIEEAKTRARAIGQPVALKLSTALHSHKTDVGGVVLNISEMIELEKAYVRLTELRERLDPQAAIVIEPMADAGVELFVGVQRHEAFGPVLGLGLGGIWVELVKDVAFCLLPASRSDFRRTLSELKSWPKLREGFRHLPAVDDEPVMDFLESIAAFASNHPEVSEMDLNPVMIHPGGAVVVDARIVIG